MQKQVRVAAVLLAGVASVVALGASGSTPASNSGSSGNASTSTSSAASTPSTARTRQVTGKLVTLGAGSYVGGKDVAVGLYDVTPGAGQSGNFIVQGGDAYDEILGSDGVPKTRAKISDGDKIQISSLSQVTFTPVTTPFVTSQGPVTLYAGTWTVGEDLGAGRYVATPGPGQSGNFIVEAEGADEILGSDGVPSVHVNLKDGDVVTISSLSQVTMTPA